MGWWEDVTKPKPPVTDPNDNYGPGKIPLAGKSAVTAKPPTVPKKPVTKPVGVRPASPDLNMRSILESSGYEQEEYAQMILNDIGGRELSIVSRIGALNGNEITYQPITDLSFAVLENNSLNIEPNPNSKTSFFDVVALDLDEFIPTKQELIVDGYTSVVYFDNADGSVRINVKNITNELVEIEFVRIESINDDTIYYGDSTNYSS
jgi:hypothetical protein